VLQGFPRYDISSPHLPHPFTLPFPQHAQADHRRQDGSLRMDHAFTLHFLTRATSAFFSEPRSGHLGYPGSRILLRSTTDVLFRPIHQELGGACVYRFWHGGRATLVKCFCIVPLFTLPWMKSRTLFELSLQGAGKYSPPLMCHGILPWRLSPPAGGAFSKLDPPHAFPWGRPPPCAYLPKPVPVRAPWFFFWYF